MLDIILIAVLLFIAISGFRKGLVKSLISMCGNLIALALSYVLAAPATVWLNANFGLTEKVAVLVREIIPMPDNFFTLATDFEGMGQLYTYLEQSFLSDSMKRSFLAAVQEQVNAVGQGVYMTMADTIARAVADLIMQGVVFIALWALLCVLLFLLGRILTGMRHRVHWSDGLGGMVVSVVLAVVTIMILYDGISVLGYVKGSMFAESDILHFVNELLNSEIDLKDSLTNLLGGWKNA